MKIGIFDSGLGGLSVLHCAQKLRPENEYIFYADEKNVPYGEKTPLKVREYTKNALDFLAGKHVDAIIIACNTATSSFPRAIREKYCIPIIGMEPAVKKAIDLYGHENKRILTLATEITIHGDKLRQLIGQVDQKQQIDLMALPGLVRFAEKGIFFGTVVNTYLRMALKEYDKETCGTIVLGCTHFNYYKKILSELFKDSVHFIDGNMGTVQQAFKSIEQIRESDSPTSGIDYYFSGERIPAAKMHLIEQCLEQLERVYDL